MTWVKIDDRFPDHPKALALGDDYDACVVLHLRGLCYCAANLTDGFIPSRIFKGYEDQIDALVSVGLWKDARGGYQIHDYLDYNPSREKVLEDRARGAERVQRWRESRNGECNGVTNGVSADGPVPVPLSPNPKRLKDKPLSSNKAAKDLDEGLLGYWISKSGKEPTASDALTLATLSKRYGPAGVKTAIGQACVQGAAPDNYGLITAIAKKESS